MKNVNSIYSGIDFKKQYNLACPKKKWKWLSKKYITGKSEFLSKAKRIDKKKALHFLEETRTGLDL